MPEVWPATLPQKMNSNDYQQAVPNNLIRSTMEYGPAKVRRRTSSTPWPVTGSMRMTDTQLNEFLTFVDVTLLGGSLPFNFPAQRGAGTWLCRFGNDGLPTFRPDGSYEGAEGWTVTLKLEVMP